MRISDFDYSLPDELIARYPKRERRASRLLEVGGGLADRQFAELPTLLRPGDLLVFNDTRVIHARLRGRKATGGRVEVLVERVTGDTRALAQVRATVHHVLRHEIAHHFGSSDERLREIEAY